MNSRDCCYGYCYDDDDGDGDVDCDCGDVDDDVREAESAPDDWVVP